MYTLYLDTHYKDINIFLFKDKQLLDKIIILNSMSTTKETMPNLIKLLENNHITIRDINKIAVNIGPGSFTGIRIGVTIAKVIAYSLKIDIISLTSLDIVSFNVQDKGYIGVKENNGYFVGYYDKEIKDIKYYKKAEFEEFTKEKNIILDESINCSRLIDYINEKKPENPYNINPLYVKDLEVSYVKKD